MSAEWFYSDGANRQGPVTEDDLKRRAADGLLKPDDLVWKNGMPDWVEARTVAVLFPKSAAPADRPSGSSIRGRLDRAFDDDDRPSRRGRYDDEDDDRPRTRRRFDDDGDQRSDELDRARSRRDDDDDRPRRRDDDDDDRPRVRRRYDDDEEVDRPRRRKGLPPDVQSTKMAAGLLAIFLGWIGIHKFYLGYNGPGALYITMTVVAWTLMFVSCGILFFLPMIPSIMALIEGIIYLTKSDRDFYEIYMRGQRDWF
ncbi:MAG TPA: GYF domain-containing protein [Gemmataceae bacterium]|nr:GYF domain-containing protein [Gemmataceae bacterium]